MNERVLESGSGEKNVEKLLSRYPETCRQRWWWQCQCHHVTAICWQWLYDFYFWNSFHCCTLARTAHPEEKRTAKIFFNKCHSNEHKWQINKEERKKILDAEAEAEEGWCDVYMCRNVAWLTTQCREQNKRHFSRELASTKVHNEKASARENNEIQDNVTSGPSERRGKVTWKRDGWEKGHEKKICKTAR